MAELVKWTHTEAVLKEYCTDLEELYKSKLRDRGRIASQELINSVSCRVVAGETIIAVDMDLAAYWKYVEWDTKAHWMPPGTLLNWIRVKPIIPTPDSRGRIPTPKQLDYLIRRAIAGKSPNQAHLKNPQGGTRGSHDLRDSVKEINEQYNERIADAVSQDVGEQIDVILRVFAR